MGPVPRRDPTVSDASQTLVFGFDQEPPVDGMSDRAAHPHVSELRGLGLKAEIHRGNSCGTTRLETRVLFEHRQKQRGNRAHGQVPLPREHPESPRVVVADHHQLEARVLGLATMPVGIGEKLHDPRIASDQSVRSRAHRKRIVGGCDLSVCVSASHDRKLQIGEERRMRLVQHEENRSRAGHLHPRDPAVVARVAAPEVGIDHAAKRLEHVLDGQRRAVAEPETSSQRDLVLRRAVRDDRLGEVRHDLQGVWIDGDERREDQPGYSQPVRISDEPRIELLGVPWKHDHQRVGIGLGGASTGRADH